MNGCGLEIDDGKSAFENFIVFNRMNRNSRKIVPLSTPMNHFVTFSERELVSLFWKRDSLKKWMLELVQKTILSCESYGGIQDSWLSGQAPGTLIQHLLADVNPDNRDGRPRRKQGYRDAITTMSLDDAKSHLAILRNPNFDPRNYHRKGYVLTGSISTDGFRLNLYALKMKELLAVRYRRLPEAVLPPRLTSTVGGTNSYLHEIRNVVKTKEDVSQLWPGCPPEKIKILCLDLGQAFVVAGYVLLPESNGPADKKGKKPQIAVAQVVHHNFSMSQKAVYQPMFKFRRWAEQRKRSVPDDSTPSIQELESTLPPLRGPDANFAGYVQQLKMVEGRLSDFYNGANHLYKSHAWDAERAMHEEFLAIADRLLKSVGGSHGVKRDPNNMVVIVFGLGEFGSHSRLSSLHSKFQVFFRDLVSAFCRQ